MQAIVSAIDDPHREMVENVWGELKAVFGLQGVTGATDPHLTYHIAESYDADAIERALSTLALAQPRFAIETHGLGVFRGDETVIYLHVSPSPPLAQMHRILADATALIARDQKPAYAPETWVPHITLAAGDLTEEILPLALQLLNRREYNWQIAITNICLVPDTTAAAAQWRRFDFKR